MRNKVDSTKKEKETTLVAAQPNKPKRGRGGSENFPNARFRPETEEDKALVSQLLGEVLTEYRQPRVRSDEELTERLDDYFRRCAERGQTPTVEEMCLSTGYSIQTVKEWQYGINHGFSPQTATIIKKAKDFMQTFDAKLVIAGKMNFLAYCFRAKNYYGMRDQQDLNFVQPNPLGETKSPEELRRKYLEDIGADPDIIDAEVSD